MKFCRAGRGGGRFSGFKQSDLILNYTFPCWLTTKCTGLLPLLFLCVSLVSHLKAQCFYLEIEQLYFGEKQAIFLNWVNSVSRLTYCQYNEPTIVCMCAYVLVCVRVYNIFGSPIIRLTVCKAKLMSWTSTDWISVQIVCLFQRDSMFSSYLFCLLQSFFSH